MAATEAEYIAIATRLGLDLAWRQQIRAFLHQHHDLLFEDQASIRALEAFLHQVVRSRLIRDFEGPPEGLELAL